MEEDRTSIIEKIIEAYKKYAPKNITLEQFTTMVEHDPVLLREVENDTLGEFSTFNVKLSKRFRTLNTSNMGSKDDFRNLLKDSLDVTAIEKRAKDIAKVYEEIICSDDEILIDAWTFDVLTEEQKHILAIKIVNALNKYFNIEKTLDVNYTGKAINRLPENSFSYSVYNFIQNFITRFWSKKRKYGQYGGYYSNARGELVVAYKESFENFISTLSHEYGHFIDHNFPDLGMLGAQTAYYGWFVYDSENGDERYHANPTETSSFKIGEVASMHIKLVLKEQAKKKPELYVKTIKSVLSKLNLEFAGLKLKHKKALDRFTDIKFMVKRRKHKSFYELSKAEREKIWAEVEKDPRLKEYEQVSQEYWETAFALRDNMIDATSFYELSDAEQNEIWAKIEEAPSFANIKNKYRSLMDLRDQIRREIYPDFYDLSKEQQQKIWDQVKKNPFVKIAEWRYNLASSDAYWRINRYEQLLADFEAEQLTEKAGLNKEMVDR